MHVVATAGHVDHGKSSLVRALTGSDPDRLAEEHRRGLSIELGFCWTHLPTVGEVAFVDVPGHERFVPTMLSGVGPVPAALFVVAADDPWMPQAAEHLAALDAFGVRHGVVAVTRSDLADPAPAFERAGAEVAGTSLRDAAVVAVSAHTGRGMEDLRVALATMLHRLPPSDPTADVRLWVDRRFSVHGAGTVVTGTLPTGAVGVGDVLETTSGDHVRVRGVQTLGREVETASAVARVALRLGGPVPADLDRGDVLVTPQAWRPTQVVDVRLGSGEPPPPRRPLLHVGAASVPCHLRPLGGRIVRLSLERPLPLRVADRALLRDPGSSRIWGVRVLDPAPPPLRRRGDARRRADRLGSAHTRLPDLADELARRGWARAALLRQIGVPLDDADRVAVAAGGWLLDRRRVDTLRGRLAELVEAYAREHPLEPGPPVAAVVRALDLPTPGLVPALLGSGMRIEQGRVVARSGSALPSEIEGALRRLAEDLAQRPFAAPDAARMAELGLHRRAVAAAERAGRLVRLGDGVVLLRGADELAATLLADLPQPFTASQARVRLGTSRRVALPLLELLDRRGLTQRLPDDRRRVNEQTVHGQHRQG